MSAKHTPATLRIQARLERLELDHLRKLCAAQAEIIEELQRELSSAYAAADMWEQLGHEAAERLDARLTLSKDGQVGLLQGEQP